MTNEPKCAILDDYQDASSAAADWSALDGRLQCDRFDVPFLHDDATVAALADYDAVVAMRERTPFPAGVLARLPKLRLIVSTGMGNAAIDMEAARANGVTVCGTRGTVGPAAELAWALLLGLMRNIPAESENLRGNGQQWQLTVGSGLSGRTLGVVGLGKLGRLVAGYGKAFGMDVIGWNRTNGLEACTGLGIGHAAGIDDLLARSDVVSLHLRLTEETRHVIGRREIGLMKPDSVIVNTARGPLVDEEALIEALESGRLAGAALDVFDREPLPASHPFRRLANVLATPHIGYVTRETYEIFYADAVECLSAWLDGSPVRVLNGE